MLSGKVKLRPKPQRNWPEIAAFLRLEIPQSYTTLPDVLQSFRFELKAAAV